ncbi:MAG: hypothetical protein P1P74_11720 [Desulfuromonadales bacterium]|nr:hypothetical protein [Desulfuromonadales bacterium]
MMKNLASGKTVSRFRNSVNLTTLEKILLFLAVLMLFAFGVSVVHSFDIFWQLQSGKYILQTKSFIYTDIFSLAADAQRWEHCWLHDIVVYLAWLAGGYDGISVFKGVMVVATAVTAVSAARLREASLLAILFIAPVALLMTRGGWLERPQLWSFLLFTLFVLVLERHRVRGDKVIFLLVPAMALWANLHAGYILAFCVLLAYLVGEGVPMFLTLRTAMSRRAYLRLVSASVLVGVAVLCTPYSGKVITSLVAQVSHIKTLGGNTAVRGIMANANMDWRPTTFFTEPTFYYAVAISAVLLLLGWRRLSLTDLCLWSGMTLIGFTLSRHVPLYFFTVAILLPRYADAALKPLVSRLGVKVNLVLRVAGQVAAVGVIIYFSLPVYRTYGFFNTGLRTWHYPIEAAAFVKENKLPANIYNTYDWGGYLMWTLYPEYQVFWDGRQNSAKMFNDGLNVMSAKPRWKEILTTHDVKTIVSKACMVSNGQSYPILRVLGRDPDWALVFHDDSSLVFVRVDAVDPTWLSRHRLAPQRIEDTILSEALLLVNVDANRYAGWWEIAQITLKRKQYSAAFQALRQHLRRSPTKNPLAESYYRQLLPLVQSGQVALPGRR